MRTPSARVLPRRCARVRRRGRQRGQFRPFSAFDGGAKNTHAGDVGMTRDAVRSAAAEGDGDALVPHATVSEGTVHAVLVARRPRVGLEDGGGQPPAEAHGDGFDLGGGGVEARRVHPRIRREVPQDAGEGDGRERRRSRDQGAHASLA